MAEAQKFDVSVSGSPVSARDWLRAARASREEVEELGVSARREDLARIFAEERLRVRGLAFGNKVEDVLAGLGADFRLIGVVAEPGKERWLVRVQTGQGVVTVAVPENLADDVVDSGALQDLDELRRHLETWLMRTDLIAPRSGK